MSILIPPSLARSKRVNGYLAMSRAFGDLPLKSCGLVATPDVFTRTLTSNDAFLLLSSDGISESLPNQKAVDIVKKSKTPQEAAENLTRECEYV